MSKAIWLQALAALATLCPLLFLNIAVFAGNSDALFYTTYLKLVAHALAEGHWYIRWLPEANAGMGSPVALFYHPLSYEITSLLGWPIASFDPTGWKRLVLGMFVAQWIGGIAAYVWLSRLVSPRSALWASLLFTLFPYKFIYIFMHINLAQIWALALMPLMMLAADDMIKGKRIGIPIYAVSLALLGIFHPRSAVAFDALPVLYMMIFCANQFRAQFFLVVSHALAVALAATYLIPAEMNVNLIQASLANLGRMNYADNLSHKDLLYNLPYAVIAAVCFGLTFRVPELRKSMAAKQIYFFIAALIVITFLCLRISRPLWDAIPLLQFLQFPVARLHAPALIAATALAAFFFEYRKNTTTMRWFYSPITYLAFVTVTGVMTLSYVRDTYAKAQNIDWNYVTDMQRYRQILPPEYMTRWQHIEENTPQAMRDAEDMKFIDLIQGRGSLYATYQDLRDFHIKAQIRTDGARMRVHQLFLPEWQAENAVISPDIGGLVVLSFMSGDYDFMLTLAPFPGEIAGNIVTLVALGVTLMLFFRLRGKPQIATIE